MSYKLLVTDIDGTLADAEGTISEIDLHALQRIHKRGVMISLCTGRAAGGCHQFLDRLSMDGLHIFFDGALITDSGLEKNIYCVPIAEDVLSQVYTRALSEGLNLELFTRSGYFVGKQDYFSDIHKTLMDFHPVIADLDEVIATQPVILACMVIPVSEEKRVVTLFDTLKDSINICPTSHPAYPDIRLVNITANGVNKASALEALVEYLGITIEDVVAIGDGINDIPLLECAGTAVAMGDSHDQLKAIADYITADVEHNGLAQAIDRFFPV